MQSSWAWPAWLGTWISCMAHGQMNSSRISSSSSRWCYSRCYSRMHPLSLTRPFYLHPLQGAASCWEHSQGAARAGPPSLQVLCTLARLRASCSCPTCTCAQDRPCLHQQLVVVVGAPIRTLAAAVAAAVATGTGAAYPLCGMWLAASGCRFTMLQSMHSLLRRLLQNRSHTA